MEKLTQMKPADLRMTLDRLIGTYLADEQVVITRMDRDRLITQIIDESVGYGPLEPLLEDEEITEVVVNGPDSIYYEKKGRLHRTEIRFRDEEALRNVIDRIVAPLERRVDVSSPMVDARLPDGSRVNAVIPPIGLKGLSYPFGSSVKIPIRLDDLIGFNQSDTGDGPISNQLGPLQAQSNHFWGTGSGKTTLLNALACFIPESERIITIEDMAELRIPHPHVAGWKPVPPTWKEKGK